MRSAEVRDSFTGFFEEHSHRAYPSAPLVPHGDPTLLFTNAGMVQFKDVFLGLAKPGSPRAVTVQKCMRVSGKHNDLENVGPSPRHHTFFEMLGNFSFGDYFKEEAIRLAWELVTERWGLAPEHLWATVFEEDDEAEALWRKIAGLPSKRVLRRPAKDNFWAMGDTGPCGPCSEIFVDRAPDRPHVDWDEGSESGRYLEIWNLVFMQFERREDGETTPLPDPSIDTGAGLERVAAVLQGVDSNYDTDLFQPILRATAELASTHYGAADDSDVHLRVIADHLRAVTFLLADGVIPSNEGRGYVLRRILRRALRHGLKLGFEEPFLHRLPPIVREVMGESYSELAEVESASAESIEAEEVKFLNTLATGSVQVQEAIESARAADRDSLSGAEAFRFYDTLGLPLELIREIAEEERFGVDEDGFAKELEAQRQRSRAAVGEGARLPAVREALRKGAELAATEFVGYRSLGAESATVVALASLEESGAQAVPTLGAGEGVVVLDRTPFYAEAGGQLGDRGRLSWEGGKARVVDTRKDEAGTYFHLAEVESGELRQGDAVVPEVERDWRAPTQRNHTATHLLHAALRHVLGQGVRQAGSLVAPDRLRFDFTYGKPVTPEELRRIEELVNRWVLRADDVVVTDGRDYREALDAGAMALFGEKYADKVRTVEVAGFDSGDGPEASLELCGGCHVRNTGEIGTLVIVSERGVASGVRRIEALSGEGALAYLAEQRALVEGAAGRLGVEAFRLPDEVERLRTRGKELERELARLRLEMVAGRAGDEAETEVEGVRVVAREVPPAPPNELREMADRLRGQGDEGVVVLASRGDGRVSLVAAVSQGLVGRLHAGRLAGKVAALVGGKGGGRPDFAQAGGREPDRLPEALGAVPELVRAELGAGG